MSLPTGLPTRRKFLERSVLGAGGVLFLPELLASCTDHTIPPTDTPIIPWPLTDSGFDWNGAAKIAVVTGLKQIPEVGEILGPLVEIFWKPDENVWDKVKTQTEAFVNQAVANLVYQLVTEDLDGLNGSILKYQNYLKTGTKSEILSQWMITVDDFVTARPHFQAENNELPLFGMFIQFTNMYLALLRDGIVFGQSWGRSDADHLQDIGDLEKAITDAKSYTSWVIDLGASKLPPTGINNHLCEPFRTYNSYDRQMTLLAGDYQMTWDYYKANLYPNGAKNPDGTPINILPREIYSDPLGTCDDSGLIILTASAPTQFPTNLTVWGDGYLLDAVQLTYPQGSGPNGVTQTARMGNPDHYMASTQPPSGGSFTISPDNPITQVRGSYAATLEALQFRFYDGTTTTILGGNAGSWPYYPPSYITFPNEALSSIHINGINKFYGNADCAVFGFKYWQSPTATLNAIQNIYVKSPKEHSMADFAKAFPNLPANLITDELKAARAAYWAAVEARAKALK